MTDAPRRSPVAVGADRATGIGRGRRAFMGRAVRVLGAAAMVDLASLAAAPALGATVPADDKRLKTATVRQTVSLGRTLPMYMALPARARGRHPAVMVVHGDDGLDEPTRDLTRRVALLGYVGCAPDFLSRAGGTPADGRAAHVLTAGLDRREATNDAAATVEWLGRNPPHHHVFTGRVGAIGFRWGGGLVNRLACAAGSALAAGVAYDGAAPDPADAVEVTAPLQLHFAEKDPQVAPTGLAWANALRAAGRPVEAYLYPGADRVFPGDDLAEGADTTAARLAWERTTAFLKSKLQ